ncbi:MAG: CAP domain-containing protein [Anaerolineales bacterium]|jgi:uncharacterized protein YkwD
MKNKSGPVFVFCIGLILLTSLAPVQRISRPVTAATLDTQVFLPFSLKSQNFAKLPNEWLVLVNQYRSSAGVPTVTEDLTLSDNCYQHARYMAENNDLTHNQDPSLPYASAAGQICAQHGDAWLGAAYSQPIWTVSDSVNGWMGSVGHRLWLLYPTTPIFGYGFYTADNNRAAAALDVLSRAEFNKDAAYNGWPVRYPAPDETGIPAVKFPITVNWSYIGDTPQLNSASLTAVSGGAVSIHADAALPGNHKGIQILPDDALKPNTRYEVSLNGTYAGQPFSYTWQFTTGD